jgi:hypothetical protein
MMVSVYWQRRRQMTTLTQSEINKIDAVERTSLWQDRIYITLRGVDSHANADLRTKIWVRGKTLTIESGKGYHSDGFIASKEALVSSLTALGAEVVVR